MALTAVATRTFAVPPPKRIAALPTSPAGYPIPWFVDQRGDPVDPDFRVMDGEKMKQALARRLCWVCGTRMTGPTDTFLVGPMCAVNHTSAEPPSHKECARWSAMTCPFLTNPKKHRREAGLPAEQAEVPGVMIARNPGVALLWSTHSGGWRTFDAGNGRLFDIGEPVSVSWWAEGRRADRGEVMASIESGLPILARMAIEEGPDAYAELTRRVDATLALLPDT